MIPVLLLTLAQAAPATPAQQAEAIFARYARTDGPGCAVGVARGEQTLWRAAYGMADLEHGVPLKPESVIEAGSVSKQFTAAAVLELVRDGKLSLDARVRQYLPELDEAADRVTIRQMLNHTSGLRDWGSLAAIAGWPRGRRALTHDHVLEILARQRALNYAPGAEYSYSNSGYNLAAIIVARVAKQPFAQFTRERLFVPLGLKATQWRDDFTRIVPGRAIAYSGEGAGMRQEMPFENVHGNGGLLTTVDDLLRWNRAYPHFAALLETGRLNDGRRLAYALGLRSGEWRGQKEVSHSGATAGYRAWLARYPELDNLSVAVLCNAASAAAPELGHRVAAVFANGKLAPLPARTRVTEAQAGLYRSLRDGHARKVASGTLLPEGAEFQGTRVRLGTESDGGEWFERVEAVPATLTPEQAAAYTGVYESDEAETRWRIAFENGRLVAFQRPQTRIALTPSYRDAFESSAGAVRFVRDGQQRVIALSLGQSRVWDLRLRKVN